MTMIFGRLNPKLHGRGIKVKDLPDLTGEGRRCHCGRKTKRVRERVTFERVCVGCRKYTRLCECKPVEATE